jgi:hypothetical protein
LKQTWDETHGWRSQPEPHADAEVNESSQQSRPASDPPSFTSLSGPGGPDRDLEQAG